MQDRANIITGFLRRVLKTGSKGLKGSIFIQVHQPLNLRSLEIFPLENHLNQSKGWVTHYINYSINCLLVVYF